MLIYNYHCSWHTSGKKTLASKSLHLKWFISKHSTALWQEISLLLLKREQRFRTYSLKDSGKKINLKCICLHLRKRVTFYIRRNALKYNFSLQLQSPEIVTGIN
jgi:hypothetical protein